MKREQTSKARHQARIIAYSRKVKASIAKRERESFSSRIVETP